MSNIKNPNRKVTIKDLQYILGCSYKTALKHYKNFLILQEKKVGFLINKDLMDLGFDMIY